MRFGEGGLQIKIKIFVRPPALTQRCVGPGRGRSQIAPTPSIALEADSQATDSQATDSQATDSLKYWQDWQFVFRLPRLPRLPMAVGILGHSFVHCPNCQGFMRQISAGKRKLQKTRFMGQIGKIVTPEKSARPFVGNSLQNICYIHIFLQP